MTEVHMETYLNALHAKLFYFNFHPLEVVSRYRDPHFQVGENYSYLFNLRPNFYKYWCLDTHFSLLAAILGLCCFICWQCLWCWLYRWEPVSWPPSWIYFVLFVVDSVCGAGYIGGSGSPGWHLGFMLFYLFVDSVCGAGSIGWSGSPGCHLGFMLFYLFVDSVCGAGYIGGSGSPGRHLNCLLRPLLLQQDLLWQLLQTTKSQGVQQDGHRWIRTHADDRRRRIRLGIGIIC